jgi:hypothetical protein
MPFDPLSEHEVSTLLVLLILVTVLAIAAGLWALRRLRAMNAAERVAALQHERTSRTLIDGLVDHYRGSPHHEAVLLELQAIRRRYGQYGLRNGHIVWIMKKVDGDIPADEEAPSFARSGAPDASTTP